MLIEAKKQLACFFARVAAWQASQCATGTMATSVQYRLTLQYDDLCEIMVK